MSVVNSQVGAQFARKTAPKFVGYRVKLDTWKPADQTKMVTLEDEDTEEVMAHNFSGGGTRATCEMYQEVGSPDLVTSQVLPDTDGNGWVVEKADPIDFGAKAARFSVTLYFSDAEDTTQVS